MWWHWRPLWYSLSPRLRPNDEKDEKVMTRMTNDPNWWRGESCVMTDVTTAHNMWRPKWWPKYNPNDPVDNGWLPWMIHVMICWRPWNFFDNIWRFNLAIFIAKDKSFLSCCCKAFHSNPYDYCKFWVLSTQEC
jgi:hypothetical protein